MRCPNCGKEVTNGARYCDSCGMAMTGGMTQNTLSGTVPCGGIPDEYKPISMWGYFGYQILFGIPCVGFILLLVFSFGGTKNVNLKNFARSYFCIMIIVIAVAVLLFLLGAGRGGF